MAKNYYVKWHPLEAIPTRLYCEGVHDDYEGFRILLKGEDASTPTLRIAFDAALAYRNIDEGDLRETIDGIENPETSSLFIVRESTWLEWFHRESRGIHDDESITHYAIYTENDCIDVLSAFSPRVEWLNP